MAIRGRKLIAPGLLKRPSHYRLHAFQICKAIFMGSTALLIRQILHGRRQGLQPRLRPHEQIPRELTIT